jgi:hypothetical protein
VGVGFHTDAFPLTEKSAPSYSGGTKAQRINHRKH